MISRDWTNLCHFKGSSSKPKYFLTLQQISFIILRFELLYYRTDQLVKQLLKLKSIIDLITDLGEDDKGNGDNDDDADNNNGDNGDDNDLQERTHIHQGSKSYRSP